ncbi:hypothetical protein CC86DRAFT_405380 [Ophiobolus disseminans]|uniref:Uncharacterized protein n=1 Tax=Ophiobolus disseminans TaxID=1469910 RepID=A0A6A7A289_9PLEO|nr:hypothetical protein CC86DRAFT_405380 [Ophiobolus disseminans]
MDQFWEEEVAAEAALEFGPLPVRLSMKPEHFVKHVGSPEMILMLISSYPTLHPDSSVHLEYGTSDDLGNESQFLLFSKLGYHKVRLRKQGMLHVVAFPRRLERKQFLGGGQSLLRKIPAALRNQWFESSETLIAWAQASVSVFTGHTGKERYQHYLKKSGKKFEAVWLQGTPRHAAELPCAWLEFADDGTTITRLTVGSFHGKRIVRYRAHVPSEIQTSIAFRELLLGFATTILFGSPLLPAYLSSMNWHRSISNGIIIPLSAFQDFTVMNDTLSEYFRRPMLGHSKMDRLFKKMKL